MACLKFTLYLDSSFPRKLWRNDLRSLTRLFQEASLGHYSIEILHLANERQRAFHDGVVHAPTILLEQPCGRKKILGNPADTQQFLKLLNLARTPELIDSSLFKNLLSNARALESC